MTIRPRSASSCTPSSPPARRRRTPRSGTRPGRSSTSIVGSGAPGACRRQYEACPDPRRSFAVTSMTAPLRRVAVRGPADARGLRRRRLGAATRPAAGGRAARRPGRRARGGRSARSTSCCPPRVSPTPATPTTRSSSPEAGMVVLRQAKPCRSAEPPLLASELAGLGVPEVGRLTGDARADGGDLFWLDDHTLAVGRSHRTNAEAHAQLAALLEPEGVRVAALPPAVAPRPRRGPPPDVGHQPGRTRPGGRLRADRADAAARRARPPAGISWIPVSDEDYARPRLQRPRHRAPDA